MKTPRVHILEGHTIYDGTKQYLVTACLRLLKKDHTPALVGRAYILEDRRTDEITCTKCRARYGLFERATSTHEERDYLLSRWNEEQIFHNIALTACSDETWVWIKPAKYPNVTVCIAPRK